MQRVGCNSCFYKGQLFVNDSEPDSNILLGQVEDRHTIPDWREQRIAIRCEDEIASTVDGAEEV